MKTRDRILQASLAMFNEQGERNVSTNHIAAELGMSPGNLYYHFSNKAEIIFELFSAYRDLVVNTLVLPVDRPLTFDDKVGYFEVIFQNMWDYRFLHRDLEHLLKESEQLREHYLVFSSTTVATGKAIIKGMVESGLVVASNDEVDALMLNLWVILTSWSSFLQSIEVQKDKPNTMDPWALKRGIYQIICLLEPYATDIAREELPALKKSYLGDQDTDPLSLFKDTALYQ
ncbi:hypothetical protein A9Q99_22350 [Gammaproteobacteria bacterium 45_16_T64]|nr:hypothetical protein A9Q99_22350 [Gammaproteobacteria bacterium 45_16_T64]